MKKKIGDLTLREIKKERDKACSAQPDCSECPFRHCCISDVFDLEQEVEVEDNE